MAALVARLGMQWQRTSIRKVIRPCSKDMAPGAIIGLRGSMVKFESRSRHLEVCTFAAPRPFYINRQIMMALRTLGVPDETFLDIYANVGNGLDSIEHGGRAAEQVRSQVAYASLPRCCKRVSAMARLKRD